MEYGNEEALLRRAQAGPEGIAAVYDAYADRVYGFLMKRCGHRETAEDITSKVFMKFIEHKIYNLWDGAGKVQPSINDVARQLKLRASKVPSQFVVSKLLLRFCGSKYMVS